MALLDFSSRNDRIAHRASTPFATLQQRLAVWHSRRALSRLDARALEDIGVTRDAAVREARKGIWDVPSNWTNR